MKEYICTVTGALGGLVASFFGGWSTALTILCFFMAADYITGLMVAGIFKKSPKSQNGGLESRAGLKGLCRKGIILLIIFVAAGLDTVMGLHYLKDGACIAFIANEALSITENAALMGVPMLPLIEKAIDILKTKADEKDGDNKHD